MILCVVQKHQELSKLNWARCIPQCQLFKRCIQNHSERQICIEKNVSYKLEPCKLFHNFHISNKIQKPPKNNMISIFPWHVARIPSHFDFVSLKTSHGFCRFFTWNPRWFRVPDSHPSKESIRVWSTSKEGLCHKCLVWQGVPGEFLKMDL